MQYPNSNEAKSNRLGDDDYFWLETSEPSLDAIWDNCDDDIYASYSNADLYRRKL